MTPPPPPRGPGHPRSENAAVLSPARPALPAPVVLSPALDDVQLTIATEALAHGRWTRVRTLLAETGEDWDLRGHRLTVLARCPGSAAWARDWQLADPESGDAATLLACATVQLAVRGTGSAEAAARECRTAARMVPADPTPGSPNCSSPAAPAPRTTARTPSRRYGPATPTTTTRTTS